MTSERLSGEDCNNEQGKSGKGKTAGKPAQGGKAWPSVPTPSPRAAGPSRSPSRRPRAGKRPRSRGFLKFLRDVRIELGKVTWPTRKDLVQSTLVVLVAVAIAAVFTFALDEVFSQAVDFVVRRLTHA